MPTHTHTHTHTQACTYTAVVSSSVLTQQCKNYSLFDAGRYRSVLTVCVCVCMYSLQTPHSSIAATVSSSHCAGSMLNISTYDIQRGSPLTSRALHVYVCWCLCSCLQADFISYCFLSSGCTGQLAFQSVPPPPSPMRCLLIWRWYIPASLCECQREGEAAREGREMLGGCW